MIFNINLLKGVNEIEFGEHAQEVRKKLKGDYEFFDQAAAHDFLTEESWVDFYGDEGVICFYDKDLFLEAMEFWEPSKLMLGDVDVLGLTMAQAVALLRRLDPETEVTLEDVTSNRFSLAVRGGDHDDDEEEPVSSFLVGRPDYYDYPSGQP